MTSGAVAAIGALAVATAIGALWRARNGKLRPRSWVKNVPGSSDSSGSAAPRAGLSTDDLGAALGDRATLVQFSSAFCAPCRATRRVLADVAAMLDGVTHIDVDAESRLDLVRRLDVRRTPTTFVLGPQGQITHRASGQPRKADVLAALGAMIGEEAGHEVQR